MNCKNCDLPLRTDYSFCSNCGAKVIRNRLTLKNLWYDFTERFFNVDNTFFRTFWHLLIQPQTVIGGYISGARKKYINPISYFAFAIILSGLMFLIIKKGYGLNFLPEEKMANGKFDKIYDYQALISYLGIPAYTIASFLVFIDIKKYNLTEHLVINTYWLAQFTIIQFFIYVIVLGLFNVSFYDLSNVFMFPTVFYILYILYKLHEISIKGIILRGLLYIPMYLIAGTSIIVPIILYLFITGEFTLQDFAPKNN